MPAKGDFSDSLYAFDTVPRDGVGKALGGLVALSPVWSGPIPLAGAGDVATGRLAVGTTIHPGRRGAESVAIGEKTARATEWFIPGMIPRGTLALVGGAMDMGKSTIAYDIAARVSVGGAIPLADGLCFDRAGVLVFGTEEEVETTILPRVRNAGGDAMNIFEFDRGRIMGGKVRFNIRDHMDFLNEELDARPGIGAMLFDPFISFLGPGINPNSETEVREVVEPLLDLLSRGDWWRWESSS